MLLLYIPINRTIMKTPKVITIIAAVIIISGGCDRIRSFFGMPTSADLEAVRPKEDFQATKDSVKIVEPVKDTTKKSVISEKPVEGRYFVVVGSFRVAANAQQLADKLSKSGYSTHLLNFKNGLIVVSAMSSANEEEALKTKQKLVDEQQMDSEEIWIYDKTKNLHIE